MRGTRLLLVLTVGTLIVLAVFAFAQNRGGEGPSNNLI